jgi:hypothetical protein
MSNFTQQLMTPLGVTAGAGIAIGGASFLYTFKRTTQLEIAQEDVKKSVESLSTFVKQVDPKIQVRLQKKVSDIESALTTLFSNIGILNKQVEIQGLKVAELIESESETRRVIEDLVEALKTQQILSFDLPAPTPVPQPKFSQRLLKPVHHHVHHSLLLPVKQQTSRIPDPLPTIENEDCADEAIDEIARLASSN